MRFYVASALFLLSLSSSLMASESREPEVKYLIEEGLVRYAIHGEGKLQEGVVWHVEGEATRCFDRFGQEEAYHVTLTESLDGIPGYHPQKRLMSKWEDGTRFMVDFEKERIVKQHLAKHRNDYDKEKMHFIGQQMVGNVICDMWESRYEKRCFYKEVPIFRSYDFLGFHYVEEATEASFSPEKKEITACLKLPDFPVIRSFALYNDPLHLGEKNTKGLVTEKLKSRFESFLLHQKEGKETERKREELLKKELAMPIFQEQKSFLNHLLEVLERTRMCLVQAEGTVEANACLSRLHQFEVQKLGGRKRQTISDWQREKESVLEHFDRSIEQLRAKMPCVRRAKSLTDLAMCIQQ